MQGRRSFVLKKLNLPNHGASIWVLVFSFLALSIPVLFIVFQTLKYTSGVFMYPLDDTFIHLKIAENVARGNWGINQNEFASASSSLLYTAVLTFFRFFSSQAVIPFLVNFLVGALLLWYLQKWLLKEGVHPIAQALIILVCIVFTPLPLLIITGMEHTLQCLTSFLFIFSFSDWLHRYLQDRSIPLPKAIFVFGVLAASVRYEGLFLIGIAACLLLYYRNLKGAFLLVVISALPVLAYGFYSISKGSFFLPNSVLIKSDTLKYGSISGFVTNVLFEKLTFARNGLAALSTQRWLIILPLLYIVFRKRMKPSYSFILIFLMAATFLQLALAATGYLYRYEAYLFFCSPAISFFLFYKYGKQVLEQWKHYTLVVVFLASVLFFPIILRSLTAFQKAGQASINIYDQQYQMAKFVGRYYNRDTVALNDIGAVSYYTKARIIDLWGLASTEVAKSKKEHYWSPRFLDSLSTKNRVKLAVIYDSWFDKGLTSRWTKAATWKIQNNVICGDDIVSFYVLNPIDKQALQGNLKEYESSLPSTVEIKYY